MRKECVATQHCLSNQLVLVAEDGRSAVSEIGFIAHHWKRDAATGEVKNAGSNGRYLDKWRLCDDGVFRIYHRVLLYDNESKMWDQSMAEQEAQDLKVRPRPESFGIHGMDDVSYTMFGDMSERVRESP